MDTVGGGFLSLFFLFPQSSHFLFYLHSIFPPPSLPFPSLTYIPNILTVFARSSPPPSLVVVIHTALPRSATRGSSFLGTPASTRHGSRNRPSPASAAAAAASRSREQRQQQQQQAGGQSSTASPAGSSAYNGKGTNKKVPGSSENDDTLSDLSVSAYTEDVLLRVGASGGAVRTRADGGRQGGKEAAAAGGAGTVPVSWAWPGAAPKRGAARGAMAIAKGIPLPPATPGSGAGSGGDNESDFGGCSGDRRSKRGARGTGGGGGGGRGGSGIGVVKAAGTGSDGEVDGYQDDDERVASNEAVPDSGDGGGGDGCGRSRTARSTARRPLRR